ncbi:hypothetical protein [Natronosalvus rutilus]|uniref:PGF-CTERM sorting domain-containing protein n=1 Tax=Natronosalvus rutilus TaxID=2953753 RepID=A0A9E7NDJ1_9EURY|nr:hypothetical protein [Natronosalvus rutilus]UTF54918.1 hypothetical protein NGM29_06590 [Natronosalvus rutilus]
MMRKKQIGALVLSLFLVASLGATAIAATQSTGASTQEEFDADPDEADEVYVSENGDAVLVYEEASNDSDAEAVSGTFGIETQTGLMHALYGADFTEMDENVSEELGVVGDASFRMSPESVTSAADLTFRDVDAYDEFSADVDLEQSRTTYSANADLAMVINESNVVEEEESVEISAQTKTTATTLTSSGTMTVEEETLIASDDTAIDMTLTQSDDQYDLSVSETRALSEYEQNNWATEEDARAALDRQFQSVAMNFGGEYDLTLESYSYDDSGESPTVDLEYSVTFTGISDQVSDMIAMQLQNDPELDLDETEARAIADRLAELQIEELQFSVETDGSAVVMDWDAEIHNYDQVVLGVIEIAESLDDVDDELADQFDEARQMIEAQKEADLVQTTEYDLSMTQAPNETSVQFSSSVDTENWGDYVDELEERDVEQFIAETTLSFEAETVDGDVTVEYDYAAEDDALLERILDEYERMAEEDPMIGDEFTEAIENFRAAEFETARATMSITEEEAEFETAAAFGNMTELEGVPFETEDGLTVTAVHGETENATTTMYVTVEGFVGEDADEAEVREQRQVGEDTTVHQPGEWDREFPSINEDEVRSFLEEGEDDDSLLPISTTAAAAAGIAGVAVIGGLFVAYRRFY